MARNGKMFSVKEALIDTQHATYNQRTDKVRCNQALLLVETKTECEGKWILDLNSSGGQKQIF